MFDETSFAKSSYVRPRLCAYGSFAEVTASGSGGMVESGGMTGTNRRP